MKLALIVLLGACVAVVLSEPCRETSDCDHEVCVGDDWNASCHRGTCTCEHDEHTGGDCSDADDCTGDCPPRLSQHCVDGTCRCIRDPVL